MAIHIANKEVDALVRELAAKRGVTIEQAVYEAVMERLQQVCPDFRPAPRKPFRRPSLKKTSPLSTDQDGNSV
jgi:hypothetical protein